MICDGWGLTQAGLAGTPEAENWRSADCSRRRGVETRKACAPRRPSAACCVARAAAPAPPRLHSLLQAPGDSQVRHIHRSIRYPSLSEIVIHTRHCFVEPFLKYSSGLLYPDQGNTGLVLNVIKFNRDPFYTCVLDQKRMVRCA